MPEMVKGAELVSAPAIMRCRCRESWSTIPGWLLVHMHSAGCKTLSGQQLCVKMSQGGTSARCMHGLHIACQGTCVHAWCAQMQVKNSALYLKHQPAALGSPAEAQRKPPVRNPRLKHGQWPRQCAGINHHSPWQCQCSHQYPSPCHRQQPAAQSPAPTRCQDAAQDSIVACLWSDATKGNGRADSPEIGQALRTTQVLQRDRMMWSRQGYAP